MDNALAMIMGQANRDNEWMVFDWIRAAKEIKKRKKTKFVLAGLHGDWPCTGGHILVYGKIPKGTYVYLASTWAIPELSIDGDLIDCYIMQSKRPEWGAKTFWPKEAKEILNLK